MNYRSFKIVLINNTFFIHSFMKIHYNLILFIYENLLIHFSLILFIHENLLIHFRLIFFIYKSLLTHFKLISFIHENSFTFYSFMKISYSRISHYLCKIHTLSHIFFEHFYDFKTHTYVQIKIKISKIAFLLKYCKFDT